MMAMTFVVMTVCATQTAVFGDGHDGRGLGVCLSVCRKRHETAIISPSMNRPAFAAA